MWSCNIWTNICIYFITISLKNNAKVRYIWKCVSLSGLVFTWVLWIFEIEILGYLEVWVRGFYMSSSLYQIISHAEARFPYFSPSHGGRNVQLSFFFFFFFNFYLFIFLFVVDFVIHWNETAKGLHVFPIPGALGKPRGNGWRGKCSAFLYVM